MCARLQRPEQIFLPAVGSQSAGPPSQLCLGTAARTCRAVPHIMQTSPGNLLNKGEVKPYSLTHAHTISHTHAFSHTHNVQVRLAFFSERFFFSLFLSPSYRSCLARLFLFSLRCCCLCTAKAKPTGQASLVEESIEYNLQILPDCRRPPILSL